MAGILANSTSVVMASSIGADAAREGFTLGEVVTFTVDPTGAAYLWSVGGPAGSVAQLTESDAAAPKLKPDQAGFYIIVCTVDATTTYVMRIEVKAITVDWAASGLHMARVAAADVPTPATGYVLFVDSSNSDLVSIKNSSGSVSTV